MSTTTGPATLAHRVQCQQTPAHPKDTMSMLTILMLVLLVAALGGGGFGYSRWGYAGWSPAALIFVVLVVLSLTGVLRWR